MPWKCFVLLYFPRQTFLISGKPASTSWSPACFRKVLAGPGIANHIKLHSQLPCSRLFHKQFCPGSIPLGPSSLYRRVTMHREHRQRGRSHHQHYSSLFIIIHHYSLHSPLRASHFHNALPPQLPPPASQLGPSWLSSLILCSLRRKWTRKRHRHGWQNHRQKLWQRKQLCCDLLLWSGAGVLQGYSRFRVLGSCRFWVRRNMAGLEGRVTIG